MQPSPVAGGEESVLSRFRAFVLRSRGLLRPVAVDAPVEQFRQVIEGFRLRVTGRLLEREEEFRVRLRLLAEWLTPYDLFSVVRISGDENRYTDLVAWVLNGGGDPDLSLRCQRAWLTGLQLPEVGQAATPQVQYRTIDGIPDLVLRYPEFAVVVEAKTDTQEHETPSGAMQTYAYADSVRRSEGVEEVHVVLLSPDGRNAANPDARCTSYVEFALAMAAELRDLPQGPLRSAFSMVLTHLITATVPGRIDWVRLAAEPDAWAGFPWRQAGVPRERFRELSDLFDVLTRRMR